LSLSVLLCVGDLKVKITVDCPFVVVELSRTEPRFWVQLASPKIFRAVIEIVPSDVEAIPFATYRMV
jgi:hypothetical protein